MRFQKIPHILSQGYPGLYILAAQGMAKTQKKGVQSQTLEFHREIPAEGVLSFAQQGVAQAGKLDTQLVVRQSTAPRKR